MCGSCTILPQNLQVEGVELDHALLHDLESAWTDQEISPQNDSEEGSSVNGPGISPDFARFVTERLQKHKSDVDSLDTTALVVSASFFAELKRNEPTAQPDVGELPPVSEHCLAIPFFPESPTQHFSRPIIVHRASVTSYQDTGADGTGNTRQIIVMTDAANDDTPVIRYRLLDGATASSRASHSAPSTTA